MDYESDVDVTMDYELDGTDVTMDYESDVNTRDVTMNPFAENMWAESHPLIEWLSESLGCGTIAMEGMFGAAEKKSFFVLLCFVAFFGYGVVLRCFAPSCVALRFFAGRNIAKIFLTRHDAGWCFTIFIKKGGSNTARRSLFTKNEKCMPPYLNHTHRVVIQ